MKMILCVLIANLVIVNQSVETVTGGNLLDDTYVNQAFNSGDVSYDGDSSFATSGDMLVGGDDYQTDADSDASSWNNATAFGDAQASAFTSNGDASFSTGATTLSNSGFTQSLNSNLLTQTQFSKPVVTQRVLSRPVITQRVISRPVIQRKVIQQPIIRRKVVRKKLINSETT